MSYLQMIEACEACIFDFDDTISTTYEVRSKSLIRALGHFGYSTDLDTITRHWGKPFNELVIALAPGVVLDTFLPHYRNVMQDDPPKLTAGARELLKYLHGRGTASIIHSSSLTALVEQDIQTLEIEHLTAAVFGSDRTAYTKPDPRSLRVVVEWLRSQDYSVDGVLYFGDSVRDLVVAQGNRLRFVAVLTGQTNANMFRDAGWSGPVAASLSDIVSDIERGNRK